METFPTPVRTAVMRTLQPCCEAPSFECNKGHARRQGRSSEAHGHAFWTTPPRLYLRNVNIKPQLRSLKSEILSSLDNQKVLTLFYENYAYSLTIDKTLLMFKILLTLRWSSKVHSQVGNFDKVLIIPSVLTETHFPRPNILLAQTVYC